MSPLRTRIAVTAVASLLVAWGFLPTVEAQQTPESTLPVGTTQVIEGLRCPETLGNLELREKDHPGQFPIDVVYHPREDSTDEFAFSCNYEGFLAPDLMGTAEVALFWTTDPSRSRPHGLRRPPCEHSGTVDVSIDEAETLFPHIPGAVYGGGWVVSDATVSAATIGVFGEPYLEPARALAVQLLAHVQDVAAPCEAGPECVFTGTVTDSGAIPGSSTRGTPDPLRDVRVALVRLSDDLDLKVAATDTDGRYRFSSSEIVFPSDFDGRNDPLAMRLRLQEAAHTPHRYEVIVPIGSTLESTSLLSDDFTFDVECEDGLVERDFALGALPETYLGELPQKEFWPDLGEIYDRVWRAWALADQLGQHLDFALPVDVLAYCTDLRICEGKDDTAFWTVTRTRGPLIGFGNDTSSLWDGGWPDNREYHEFGHHFMADAFGDAMPRLPGDENHGGYYVNPSSTDSWKEGWAEFYSMMVSKHIDEEPRPELYRIEGAYLNLEFDYRPWFALGRTEELAVAGVLLDLEDGPEDYATGHRLVDVRVVWHELVSDERGRLLVGGVVNESESVHEYSEQTMVAAVFRDQSGARLHTAWAATVPRDLPGAGGEGFFVMMLPDSLEWDELEVAAFEGRPGEVAADDDPVDLTLSEIWETIITYTSQHHAGNGHLFDVSDLHGAFRSRYRGSDADGNGMDDIDQVFIAHGLFADADGDRSYLQGSEVGRTDHAALMIPGAGELFPELVPRRDLTPLPGSLIEVDTGRVDAGIVVQVSPAPPMGHAGYSYVAYPDDDGRAHVVVPPPNVGGTVMLTAVADDHQPAAVGTIDVDRFWDDVEAAKGEPPVTFDVVLVPGAVGPRANTGWPWLLLGVGAVLVVGAGSMLVWRRIARRAME